MPVIGAYMNRIRLHIKLSDKEFERRLTEYIKLNGLNIFILTDVKPDATLTDHLQNPNELVLENIEKKMSFGKYQSADRIISSIIENLDVSFNMNSKSNCKTVFATSAHGGAGKTFISQALSIYLARSGRKVMYVNLDGLCVNDSVFKCNEEKDISLVTYYAKKGVENINKYIEGYKNYDTAKNVYFLKSIYPSFDPSLDTESAEIFIRSLNTNELYDYIVLDCSLLPFSQYFQMMKNSYKTLFIKCRGSEREDEAVTFMQNGGIDILCLCNMIRYTEGIYIPKAEEEIIYNPTSFYDAIEQIVYELEKNHGNCL